VSFTASHAHPHRFTLAAALHRALMSRYGLTRFIKFYSRLKTYSRIEIITSSSFCFAFKSCARQVLPGWHGYGLLMRVTDDTIDVRRDDVCGRVVNLVLKLDSHLLDGLKNVGQTEVS
jgi:hypothetical protein